MAVKPDASPAQPGNSESVTVVRPRDDKGPLSVSDRFVMTGGERSSGRPPPHQHRVRSTPVTRKTRIAVDESKRKRDGQISHITLPRVPWES
jgi:hypothetical protein